MGASGILRKEKATHLLNDENQFKMVKDETTVDVLYQKLGDRWFAFSMVDDELFFGSISQVEIDKGHESN